MFRIESRILACLLVVLLASSIAGAQVLLASTNPAAAGQHAIFKVIGKGSAVCLGAFQLTRDGNLLTFSTYYIGPLQTVQVSAPPIAHFDTTVIFALFEPAGGSTGGCNSVPGSFLNDSLRAPKIFETLSGGDGAPITINQVSGAVAVARALCNASISVSQGNGNGDSVSISGNALCTSFNSTVSATFDGNTYQNATAIVTFGFEEIGFQQAIGNPLLTALAGCGTPSFQTAGATLIVSCALPTTGGIFDSQGLH